jgi:methyl-accepting chemotaxis protein
MTQKKSKGVMLKLYLLTAVAVAGLLIFGVVALNTLNSVKVNGPHYQRVVQNKDLLADVLPPPNYIVETYLTAQLMLDAGSPEKLQQLIDQYASLKKVYGERQQFWLDNLAEGPLKKDINEASREPAESFFAVMDTELIPALQSGDKESAQAILMQKLPPLYEAHRTVIDRIVKVTTENAAAVEAEVAHTISVDTWTQCSVGLLLVVTICTLNLWMRRSVVEQQARDYDYVARLTSIDKAQAVIEFDMEGAIMSANDNFQHIMGYALNELKGQHHSIFAPDDSGISPEYREFWARLNRGENIVGEFQRLGKDGKEVWLQASYNPIPDASGKYIKVVSYATDITDDVKARQKMARVLQQVNENAMSLTAAADQLTTVSGQMATNADETAAQANVVSAASEEVSKNVITVSTGVEEMNSAIREIAKNASEAARVAQEAVNTANHANASISKLGDSSAEIGNVVKVITSIAEQTNLLALNATIEAARAGEAGKGFAVVANEVKELAKETARATEDISRKIETIQADTTGAVESIQQISQVISLVSDISTIIAGAVEEQTATATEMGRNVNEAARGTAEIAQNIVAVAQAAHNTTQGASNSQLAASELARMANELQKLGSDQEATPTLAV